MKAFKILVLVIIVALIQTSCSKLDVETHIFGTWILQEYLRNDVDESTEMLISDYEETYNTDWSFSRTYVDGEMEAVDETGTFSIDEEGTAIHISDVSSISNFSDQHSSLSTSTIEVLVIDDSEYVYSFENGGDKHEFRFIRKTQ